MKLRIALLSATALLSACTSYQPSANEATARLRFITHVNGATALGLQDTAACPQRRMLSVQNLGTLLVKPPHRVGVLGDPDPAGIAYSETWLPAGPNLVSMSTALPMGAAIKLCTAALALDAQPEGHYELHFHHNGQGCRLQLWQLSLQEGVVRRVREPSQRPLVAPPSGNLCGL